MPVHCTTTPLHKNTCPGVMKFIILVNFFKIIIIIPPVCLICQTEDRVLKEIVQFHYMHYLVTP